MSTLVGRIQAAASVALDTSCPRYFFRAELLTDLIAYTTHGVATAAVMRELELQGRSRPVLAAILQRTRWPQELRYELTDRERAAVVRIQQEWIEDDRRHNPGAVVAREAHLGEIETVIAALGAGVSAVVMDDRRGRHLAGARGLIAVSTGGLAIEMAATGALTGDQAFAVYEAAYGTSSRPSFDQLVADYRP